MNDKESLADLYPEAVEIWSELNQMSPSDVMPGSNIEVFWKCEKGYHQDYKRSVYRQTVILKKPHNYVCPECKKLLGYHYEDLTGNKYGELTVVGLDVPATIQHSITSTSHSTKNIKMWKCKCSCGCEITMNGNSLKYGKATTCGNRAVHYGGKNNPNWRGGVTSEHESIRKGKKYEKWRLEVYKKDNYTCQACGRRKRGSNIELHAHHIISFSSLLECDREHLYDVNIGITLCRECHFEKSNPRSLHNTYGTDDVSPKELEEFVNSMRSQMGIEEHFSVEEYMKGRSLLPLRETNPKKHQLDPNSITSKCRDAGIPRNAYYSRLRNGWSEEAAWSVPYKRSAKECKDHLGISFPSIAAMCRAWNIPRSAFDDRMKKGWGLQRILETPIKDTDTKVYDFKGNLFQSQKEMCQFYNVKPATFFQRFTKLGWTLEEALTGKQKR